jgi:cellulose synthase/poly-beta-1,6-N-acetylglucosamine synthase-like glycosyltransferase
MPISYAVLTLGIAITAYILFGYPILLAILSRKAPRAVGKDLRYQPTVSVIMAVYNGAAFLRAKLDSLLALDYPPELLQIIVVSDGSTDETVRIVHEYSSRGIQLLEVPHGGKAAAVNQALATASGEILFFTDVRQPLDRMALHHLVANFADPGVGAATGELHLTQGTEGEQADMDLYWRYEVWARQIHSRIDSIFASTGCIYALRRSLAGPIPDSTLSDDAILPLRAFFAGYRVVFDPEAIAVDSPAVSGTEFKRRRRTLAGLWQVFVRMPELFTSRNRMRFHFLSHKFSRLMLPWALLLVIGGTLALPASLFRTWLAGGILVLLFLALVDAVVPRWFPLKRFTSPARTFLIMNAASVMALAVFFTPADRLWVPTRVDSAERQ